MRLIFITNHPDLARHAQDAGVDRIMVDLEHLGKIERQGHLDTLISRHSLADVDRLRKCLDTSELEVRCNPIHGDSQNEIEAILNRGADRIMLPMFRTRTEVDTFLSLVAGRARTCLLLETPQALVRIDEIIEAPGIDEIHIGLNDLHLSMGMDFMFELLSGGIVEYAIGKIRRKDIPVGFGGISRIGTGLLDASLILSEHVRLGSQAVILSRSFHGQATTVAELEQTLNLKEEVTKLRTLVRDLAALPTSQLLANHDLTVQQVRNLVALRFSRR